MSNTVENTAFKCTVWNTIKNEIQNDLVSNISESFSVIDLRYEEAEIDRVH